MPLPTLAAALALAADPVPLDLHPSNVFDLIPSSMLMNVCHMTQERPESITAEPAYINPPWYAQMTFGDADTLITFALDEDDDRAILYVDLNANGDLTDDEPPAGERQVIPEEQRTPQLKMWIFDHFATTVPVRYHDGSEAALAITFRTYGKVCRDLYNSMPPDIVYWSTYYRAGEVPIGDATYPVAVKDQTADGLFDTLKDDTHRWADRVYIDLNRDGVFQPRGEGFEINAPFEVEGIAYEVKRISPSGDEIEIGPTARHVVQDMLRVGQLAPDFDIPGAGPLSSLRGQVVLIDFWATWCVPCLAEMPHVIRTQDEFRARGFRVVGVSIDREQDGDRMHQVARDKGMDWPEVHDHNQAIARRYFVTSIPATFLIGPDGRIIASYIRGEEMREHVERAVEALEQQAGAR